MKSLYLASIFALAVTAPVLAQPNAADVKIGGPARVTGAVGSSMTLGLGTGGVAVNDIGVIRQGAQIGGSATVSGSVGTATSIVGPMSRARIKVGVIDSANVAGSANAQGSVGSATALAPLPGTSVCLAVGAVGPGSYGSVSASGHARSVTVYDFGLFRRTSVRIGTVGRPC